MQLSKLIILIAILSCGLNGACKKSPSITWGQKDLTWEDFEGPADENSPFKAITYSQITFYLDFNKDTLYLGATAEFIPYKSWVKDKQTDYLLKHEQVHFDIVEYIARLFRKELSELTFSSYDDIKPKVTSLFENFRAKRKQMQKEYDKDTDHSKIRPRQENWNNKLDEMLADYNAYASTHFNLYIGYLKQ